MALKQAQSLSPTPSDLYVGQLDWCGDPGVCQCGDSMASTSMAEMALATAQHNLWIVL